jgi:hypothetical protein
MKEIKVCVHYKNKFAPTPEGTEFTILYENLTESPSPLVIEFLKHLKDNTSCYSYSGLTQNIDDILSQIKNSLQEMLNMLE